MSAIHSVISEGQSSLFRLRQSTHTHNSSDDKSNTLASKLNEAGLTLEADKVRQEAAETAVTAFEQARLIGGPKAAAEEKLERAEKRIRELRQEARMAAARGDREKLAQLSREAAQVARLAGKAASDFSVGVSNAAAMGKGAGDGSTTTISETSITLQQTEVTVQITLSDDASAPVNVEQPADIALTPDMEEGTPAETGMSQDELDQLLGLADSLSTDSQESQSSNMFAEAAANNDLARQRWKEADAFGRRIETVLGNVRAVINEAKRANDSDPDYESRRLRRKSLEEDDKSIAEAQEAVNDMRASAYDASPTLAGDPGAIAVQDASACEAAAEPVVSETPSVNVLA